MAKAKTVVKKNSTKKPKVETPKIYVAPPVPKLGDAPTHPIVNAKCRRGSDQMSVGQVCSSLLAENLSQPGATVVQLRCAKCKYSWNISIGGSFHTL